MAIGLDVMMCYNIRKRDLVAFEAEIQVNCSREKLWNLLMSPGHLSLTHPFCKEHIAKDWGEVGSKDSLIFNNYKQIEREIVNIEKSICTLRLTQDKSKENNTFVKFKVLELTNEKCELIISISSNSYRKVPRPIWWVYANFKLIPSYELYLSSVIKGYKYYLEHDKKVVEDQFGFHPYYSAKK